MNTSTTILHGLLVEKANQAYGLASTRSGKPGTLEALTLMEQQASLLAHVVKTGGVAGWLPPSAEIEIRIKPPAPPQTDEAKQVEYKKREEAKKQMAKRSEQLVAILSELVGRTVLSVEIESQRQRYLRFTTDAGPLLFMGVAWGNMGRLSSQPPLAGLIGQKISAIVPIDAKYQSVYGVNFEHSGTALVKLEFNDTAGIAVATGLDSPRRTPPCQFVPIQ